MLNAGVLGAPVAHSLSPVLHRAAYAQLGLTDWRYAAHEVTEEAFAAFVAGLDDSWRGLSLTMPLKEVAFQVAEDASPAAEQSGAINTLVRRADGGWDGHNTDVHGIVAALAACGPDLEGTGWQATILGSGATSRSALLAMAELGVTRVRVAARRPVAVSSVACVAEGELAVEQLPLNEWAAVPTPLVVSTLPPAASEDVARVLREEAGRNGPRTGTLLDVVYADWPTPLARAAGAAGLRVVSGLDMLVHQAAEQVLLMTGRRPDVEVMMVAGRAALAGG